MNGFDPIRGFAGLMPGQDLARVLSRLTSGDLHELIGPRLLAILPHGGTTREELEAAAQKILSDRFVASFSHANVRAALLRNLDPGKFEELKHRLGKLKAPTDHGTFDFSAAEWPEVAKFFGLDPEETASAPIALSLEEVQSNFPLFAHQRTVVRRAYCRVGSGDGRTLIHMPTGAGKTRTAMHLIARILNENEPCLVVWLAASQELLEQAAETFLKAWDALGNRSVKLARFWGRHSESLTQVNDGLVVAGLSKLYAWRKRNSTEFLRLGARTRLVVMDEAHQSIAPTYRELIDGLCSAGQYSSMIGLTATPGRTWNDIAMDQELSAYFAGNKVVLEAGSDPNPVKYLLEQGYLAKPNFRRIEYSPAVTPSRRELRAMGGSEEYSEEILSRLASDIGRNLAIIDGVKDLISRGHRRIILFAASVQHAEDLAIALASRQISAYVVSGETPAERRSAILKEFKRRSDYPIVLCNFGVLTTGFDAPQTSAAVIARPTKSLVLYSQMVGRATRGTKAGGNETCEVLTVHDPAYPGFGDIAEAFFNWEDVWSDENG